MHGYGTLVKDSQIIYEGEWRLGKKHGVGTQYFMVNRVYEKMIPAC